MTHVIAVHPLYKDVWPTAAEALRDLWLEEDEPVEFVELDSDDDQPIGIVLENAEIDDLSADCLPRDTCNPGRVSTFWRQPRKPPL